MHTALCILTEEITTDPDTKAYQENVESTSTPIHTKLIILERLSVIQDAYQLLVFLLLSACWVSGWQSDGSRTIICCLWAVTDDSTSQGKQLNHNYRHIHTCPRIKSKVSQCVILKSVCTLIQKHRTPPPHNCIRAHKHGHANVDLLLVWRRVRIWGTAEEWHRAVYRRIHK